MKMKFYFLYLLFVGCLFFQTNTAFAGLGAPSEPTLKESVRQQTKSFKQKVIEHTLTKKVKKKFNKFYKETKTAMEKNGIIKLILAIVLVLIALSLLQAISGSIKTILAVALLIVLILFLLKMLL